MPKISKIFILATAAAALSGCGTILHGPYEKLTVTSSPEKAFCKIYREGHGYMKGVATPGETYIMRDEGAVTITCSKAGYQTTSVVTSTHRAEHQDNTANLLTFAPGILMDLANSTQDRLPDTIHIDLPRE